MGHIWLIGMMGSGKTTVGALVAELLEMPLFDTDGLVMERSGRTIPDLFAESEEAFRSIEAGVVRQLSEGPAAVISTGGGVVMDDLNVDRMRGSGTTVLLDAPVQELVSRLGEADDRPLYQSPEGLTRLRAERELHYRSACDHIVDTAGLSAVEVAEEVIRCVRT